MGLYEVCGDLGARDIVSEVDLSAFRKERDHRQHFLLRIVGVLPYIFGVRCVDYVFPILQDSDSFGGVFHFEGALGCESVGELLNTIYVIYYCAIFPTGIALIRLLLLYSLRHSIHCMSTL